MPVTFDLREQGRVIYFKISEPWTMQEVLDGFTQTQAIRDKIYAEDPQRRVHSLIDLMEVTNAAPGVLRSRRAPGITHPGRGEYVVAASYLLARDLMATVFKVMHIDGKLFSSLDEAWAYLRPFLQPPPVEPGETKVSGVEENKSGGNK